MARIRTIKPDFFRHEELYKAEKETGLPLRVAFPGLWTVADREGLFKWKPSQIKLDILPFDDVDIDEVLEKLRYYGFIIKYEIDGKQFGFIPSFKDHQVINAREAASKIPQPDASLQLHVITMTREVHAHGEGKGRERKEYTRVADVACKVFAKDYKIPTQRMPAEANFYKDIDIQTERLLEVFEPDKAIEQVKAYMYHCRATDRKLIGTAHKLSETILSADWVRLNNPEARGPDNEFKEAEVNKQNWKPEAWKAHYSNEILFNPKFKQHFGL
jgi:hypothetical protein